MTDLHARAAGPTGAPAPTGARAASGTAAAAAARPRPSAVRPAPTVAVLLVVAALAATDVVMAALLPPSVVDLPGYELVAALAKAPVLVAVAAALLGVRRLADASPGAARDAAHRRVLVTAARVVVPAAGLVATVPTALLPAALRASAGWLPWLVLAGVGVAATGVLAVALLALRAWFALVAALTGAAVVLAEAVASGLELGPVLGSTAVDGLALGTAVGGLAGALLAATVWLRRRPRRARLAVASRRGLLFAAVVVGVLAGARSSPTVWVVVVAFLVLGLVVPPLLTARVRAAVPAPAPPPPGPSPDPVRVDPYATVTVGPARVAPRVPVPGLHILHLAGDDPDRPGAGAEAARAAAINRRLAGAGHRITVVCRRHRGAVDRTEHVESPEHGRGWVQWVHPRTGLGYALTAALCARASDADLVVEEFTAPFVTVAAPRWTSRPVVGVVGWFDVDLRGRRLRDVARRWAVRRHRSMVAVSVEVAQAVAAVHPRAEIVVIGHGVSPVPPRHPRGTDVVCAAPLRIGPKGLDLLLAAWARVAADLPGRLVLTGTGPQEGAVRARVQELGLGDRVLLSGAGGPAQAATALAAARVAVVPSRYEASGVAALEALAVGTPVVGFDLPTLREVVPPEAGVLVPRSPGGSDEAADVAAFARALWALHGDDERCGRAAQWGPEIARGHDWDTLAGMQGDVYRAAAGPVTLRWT